jgi:translation initiation factor 4E
MTSKPKSKNSHTTENTDTTRNMNNNNENANTTDDQVITIFHDRVNYTVKHPLENTWTLWFDNPRKKATNQTWSTNLKEIVSVDTIEDFWG